MWLFEKDMTLFDDAISLAKSSCWALHGKNVLRFIVGLTIALFYVGKALQYFEFRFIGQPNLLFSCFSFSLLRNIFVFSGWQNSFIFSTALKKKVHGIYCLGNRFAEWTFSQWFGQIENDFKKCEMKKKHAFEESNKHKMPNVSHYRQSKES